MPVSIAGELSHQVIATRFQVEEVAGQGGMGTVYRALDLQVGAMVALKVMHGAPDNSTADVERFLREAQVLSQLNHANIVRYIAHGMTALPDAAPRPFLAMEWLEGETLADRLVHGPLGETDALLLLGSIAAALDVAHKNGIVHRDRFHKRMVRRHKGASPRHRRRPHHAHSHCSCYRL